MRRCLPVGWSVVLLFTLVALVAELSASISFDDQDRAYSCRHQVLYGHITCLVITRLCPTRPP